MCQKWHIDLRNCLNTPLSHIYICMLYQLYYVMNIFTLAGEVSTGESSPTHDKDIIDCDDNDSTSVTIDATINNDLNDAVVGQ